MINFIIGEDNSIINKGIADTVHKVMFKEPVEYEVHSHYDYNEKFIEKIHEKLPNKIYILDIETPSNTGIEMARIIREKDIDSIIIFLTAYRDKYQQAILENTFLFFSFLSKKDNYIEKLEIKLKEAITAIHKKKAIRFIDCGVLYTLPIKDILYITTDTQERKTIIVTDYSSYKISKPMTEIESYFDEEMIHTHKSCIINKERITHINMREGLIYFDNGQTINLLSRRYKKEVKEAILSY